MIFSSLYKKILDTLPQAIIVCGRTGKVRFTNAAFRRYFPAATERSCRLKDVIGCAEKASACGKGASCAACRMVATMPSMPAAMRPSASKIGRASCRERV